MLMRISAKTEYACIAVLELAAQYGTGQPVRIRKIADRHGVPPRFLVQILLQLKGAGLVASTRGASGGYHLARPPEQVSLGEVMEVIEGGGEQETWRSNASPDSPAVKVLTETWEEIRAKEREWSRQITFADLLERVRTQDQHMYYI